VNFTSGLPLWKDIMVEPAPTPTVSPESLAMKRFVQEKNLALYRRLLAEQNIDQARRQLLLKLLADEESLGNR
jgi:hypothetical protein